jgi:hypothetical protein
VKHTYSPPLRFRNNASNKFLLASFLAFSFLAFSLRTIKNENDWGRQVSRLEGDDGTPRYRAENAMFSTHRVMWICVDSLLGGDRKGNSPDTDIVANVVFVCSGAVEGGGAVREGGGGFVENSFDFHIH